LAKTSAFLKPVVTDDYVMHNYRIEACLAYYTAVGKGLNGGGHL